jgi:hypothetical protein
MRMLREKEEQKEEKEISGTEASDDCPAGINRRGIFLRAIESTLMI